MAVCTVQLTGNHTKPASRGTFRATAVKSRPSRMSPYAPVRLRRAGRGAGSLPLLVDGDAGELFPLFADGVLILDAVVGVVLLTFVHVAQKVNAEVAVKTVARNAAA